MDIKGKRISPYSITTLADDEVIVFGSNLQGRHFDGLAQMAHEKFGAIWGQGTGLQGQSYAIPTMNGYDVMKRHVLEFIQFAKERPQTKFLVTRIGCGFARYEDREVAPLFKDALTVANIFLPQSFYDLLTEQQAYVKATLMGAICGDVIGSFYEFNRTKDYDFNMFDSNMEFTDDTVMTIAVADWIMNDQALSTNRLTDIMRKWGRRYNAGYGHLFYRWLWSDEYAGYDSWGNGSAMRVSACGFAFETLEQALEAAKRSAVVSHNHPEGIKGTQATAAAVWMAWNGRQKEEIRQYIAETFGYNLDRTCDNIRPTYHFEASCQETVPQSIIAFIDSKDYEDAIRLTVSLGGDSDTMGAITGAIAAAYYKAIPKAIYDFVMARLPEDIKVVVGKFEDFFNS